MNAFTIDAQLPSLNEYTNACRSHWSKGAEFKKAVESLIGSSIIIAMSQGKLVKTKKPVSVHIEWHEATKRRDADNIQSAQKFILDALQHYGIIKNDSRKYVKQVYHEIVDDEKNFVRVYLREE